MSTGLQSRTHRLPQPVRGCQGTRHLRRAEHIAWTWSQEPERFYVVMERRSPDKPSGTRTARFDPTRPTKHRSGNPGTGRSVPPVAAHSRPVRALRIKDAYLNSGHSSRRWPQRIWRDPLGGKFREISDQQFRRDNFQPVAGLRSRPVGRQPACRCGDWKAPPCSIVVGSVSPLRSSISNSGASWGETPLSPVRSMLSWTFRIFAAPGQLSHSPEDVL